MKGDQDQVARPESKDVVDTRQPDRRTKGDGREKRRLEVLRDQVCRDGRERERRTRSRKHGPPTLQPPHGEPPKILGFISLSLVPDVLKHKSSCIGSDGNA